MYSANESIRLNSMYMMIKTQTSDGLTTYPYGYEN